MSQVLVAGRLQTCTQLWNPQKGIQSISSSIGDLGRIDRRSDQVSGHAQVNATTKTREFVGAAGLTATFRRVDGHNSTQISKVEMRRLGEFSIAGRHK
jgi:hypothetical protein